MERLLAGLPEWFGIPEAAQEYVADARSLPALLAINDARQPVGVLVHRRHFPESIEIHVMAVARSYGMDVLVETHDDQEMARAGRLGADLVGVNNRDLRTFEVDLAITERLAVAAPAGALLVTESGIFGAADAARLERSGAKAMLVGESLMRQADVESATRRLLAA